jgi:phage FluMu protein Com
MPIRFRCSYCNRLLGIATRKAGTQTTCPHCGNAITVPIPHEDDGKTERINLDDVDALLGKSMDGATVKESAVAAPPAPPAPPPVPQQQEAIEPEFEEALSLPPSLPTPVKKAQPEKAQSPAAKPQAAPPAKTKAAPPPVPKPTKPKKPPDPDDPPLFEGDVDDILGTTHTPEEEERQKPPPTSGMDAMSLGDSPSRQITLSSGTATLLMAAVVVLLALSFAAGYLIAPKG